VFIKQDSYGIHQLLTFGHGTGSELEVQVFQRLGFRYDKSVDHIGGKEQKITSFDGISVTCDLKAKGICQGDKQLVGVMGMGRIPCFFGRGILDLIGANADIFHTA
jgi:hypothetical protein